MATSSTGTSGRQPRSRIVIDVEQARQSAGGGGNRRRGGRTTTTRTRKVLTVIGLVVVAGLSALLVGGYVWWRNYQTSPAYSLALLADAAQRDDLRTVDELLDSNRVAENFIPQVTDKLIEGGVPVAQTEVMRRQIALLAPQFLPGVRDALRDEVVRGVKEAVARSGRQQMPFVLLTLAVPRVIESVGDVNEPGGEADVVKTVTVKINDRPTILTMRQNGARWKVVAVRNEDLTATIAARVAASLPSLPLGERPAEQRGVRRGAPVR